MLPRVLIVLDDKKPEKRFLRLWSRVVDLEL